MLRARYRRVVDSTTLKFRYFLFILRAFSKANFVKSTFCVQIDARRPTYSYLTYYYTIGGV